MQRIEGRVVFVTGGARGIGAAIANRLAAEGGQVAIGDLDLEAARRTAERLPGRSVVVELDVTASGSVERAFREAVEELGPIDILVNNAGWDKMEPFVKSKESTWDKVLAINLRGPIRCCREVLDSMIERGRGKIVNIASDAGRVGSSGEAVYSGAKAGIIGFSKTLAREVARHGIQVNVVCPGPTRTPLLEEIAAENPKLVKALERAIPLGRLGEPEDLAGAVAFLASPDADFVTGQTLSVSGGLTMA